jgi:hypothetical protein
MSGCPNCLRDLDALDGGCQCFDQCPCRTAIESYRSGETTALTRLADLETQVSFLLREVAALKGDA